MTPPNHGTGQSRTRILQTLVGVVISIALLWWSLRGVSFRDVAERVGAARPWPIVLGVLLATATFPLRLVRWRLLLRREDGTALPNAPLWHAIAMGFMANNVLPFRAGEVVRTYAASRLTGVRLTAAFSSIAVERVFDGLTLVALLTLALFLPGLPSGVAINGVPLPTLATRTGIVCLAALLGAGFVVTFPRAAEVLVRRLVPMPKLADRLVGMIEGIRHGLAVLRSPLRLAGVILWSMIVWLVNALSFFVMFAAFGIPVSFTGALLMQSILAFGVSVPSTPGYLGVFEGAITIALAFYGVPRDQAVSYALAYHFTTFLPITLLGLWSVAQTNLGLSEMRRAGG